jgi:GNAT superfamily N-acetyltransferase
MGPIGTNHYPSEREAHIVLKDGSTLHVRPVRADDGGAIRAFLDALSPESIVFRFFGVPNLSWVINWSLDVDYTDRFALVAETGTPPEIVAHAAYIRCTPDQAEVAFMVADAFQGHGIATTLLSHLAEVAAHNEISTFIAEVMPANHRMIEMFRASGFPVEVRSSADSIEIELPTSLTPDALARGRQKLS